MCFGPRLLTHRGVVRAPLNGRAEPASGISDLLGTRCRLFSQAISASEIAGSIVFVTHSCTYLTHDLASGRATIKAAIQGLAGISKGQFLFCTSQCAWHATSNSQLFPVSFVIIIL